MIVIKYNKNPWSMQILHGFVLEDVTDTAMCYELKPSRKKKFSNIYCIRWKSKSQFVRRLNIIKKLHV